MRKIPWGMAFLVIWFVFLSACVTIYLQYLQPSKLGETVFYAIPDNLDLEYEFKYVSFQFFPEPAIIIQGVTIKNDRKNIKYEVERVQAELSWKTLIEGTPVLASVALIKPKLYFSLPDLARSDAQLESGLYVDPDLELEIEAEIKNTTLHSTQKEQVTKDAQKSLVEKLNSTTDTATTNLTKEHVGTPQNDTIQALDSENGNDNIGDDTHEMLSAFSTLSPEEQDEQMRSLIKKALQIRLPHVVSGTYVHIRDGEFELLLSQNPDKKYDILSIKDIQLDLRTPDLRDGYVDLRLGHLSLKAKRAPDIDVMETSLLIRGWNFTANKIKLGLDMQTKFQIGSLQKLRERPIKEAYQYFPMPEFAKFSIELDLAYEKNTHNLDLLGLIRSRLFLPMNGKVTTAFMDIPFSSNANIENKDKNALQMPLETKENAPYRNAFLKDNTLLPRHALSLPALHINSIKIDSAHLRVGRNAAIVTGDLLGVFPFNPLFQGRASLSHFSLPRWIGSARNMSGGLVNALDDIHGDLELIVNKRGIFAPYFKGIISGIEVEGLGSCGNFKEPDIALLAYPTEETRKKGTLDVNSFFPEINGVAVVKKEFPKPAVPARDPKDKSPSMFVDYHINIRIPDVAVWKVNAKNVYTTISPDMNETPTVTVTIGNLYGGTANAYAVLDKGKSYINATLSNVELESPVKNIAGFAAVKGQISGEAKINMSGNSTPEILSSLSVQATGNILKGSFHTDKSLLQNFNTVLYRINVKSIPFYLPNTKMPPYFQMKGDYDITLSDTTLQASVYSNAIINYSTANGLPLYMEPQTANITYITNGTNKFEAMNVDGTGLVSYDFSGKNFFQVQDFVGTLTEEKVTGLFRMDINEPLDWSGKLHFKSLDLDSYFFGEEEAKELQSTTQASRQTATQISSESSYLPVDFLSENNLAFTVSADEAKLLDVIIEDFTSTLNLKNKELTLEKTNATVRGGGKVQAFLEARITPNMAVSKGNILSQFKFQLEKANMLAISKMRGHETLLAGDGLIQLTGNGIFQTTADLLAKLNGKYNVNILNGYVEDSLASQESVEVVPDRSSALSYTASGLNSRAPSRNTTSSKTYFDTIMASGDIINGILYSTNFLMSSKSMLVKGEGTINLVTEEIEATAKADVGLSNVPITISGTISNPVTNIKLLNAVASTIGRVGTGVFSLLGSILRAPIDMLTHEKVIDTPIQTAPPMPELPPIVIDNSIR